MWWMPLNGLAHPGYLLDVATNGVRTAMGILKRIKKRLPIVGGSSDRSIRVRSAPAPRRPAPYTAPPVEDEPESPRGDRDPREWIDETVRSHPIVLFMKGTPMSPACGFSANASAILRGYAPLIHSVDILLDPEVRAEVKSYSNWPTIPQIYVGGEFLGGSDILAQLHGSGELQSMIEGLAVGASEE